MMSLVTVGNLFFEVQMLLKIFSVSSLLIERRCRSALVLLRREIMDLDSFPFSPVFELLSFVQR